jgi:hypothetical protein
MEYNTIYSLGSRCQNSLILKKNNLREFAGFFDFLNVEKVDDTIHMLNDEFNEFLKESNLITYNFNHTTFDPETNERLITSIRTANKYYQIENYMDPNYAICPHFNLKDTHDRNHFFRCIERFKKLNSYKVLFNYTYNSWENDVSDEQMQNIVNVLKEKYHIVEFKICFVSLILSKEQKYKKIIETEFYDHWDLHILKDSYTGGLFNNPIDNNNFINIINNYPLSVNKLTKNKIDFDVYD